MKENKQQTPESTLKVSDAKKKSRFLVISMTIVAFFFFFHDLKTLPIQIQLLLTLSDWMEQGSRFPASSPLINSYVTTKQPTQ